MRIFKKLRSKFTNYANRGKITSEANISRPIFDDFISFEIGEDYLGKAAKAGHAAKAAIRVGQYDAAWGLLHEQKTLYAQHANKGRWNARDVLALDGSVSEQLANILRLEAKHEQALVHILYWIITSQKPIKRHEQKLRTYFGRCKFQITTLEEVQRFIGNNKKKPDFVTIQSKINEWKDG